MIAADLFGVQAPATSLPPAERRAPQAPIQTPSTIEPGNAIPELSRRNRWAKRHCGSFLAVTTQSPV
jgi:hypothetical protein